MKKRKEFYTAIQLIVISVLLRVAFIVFTFMSQHRYMPITEYVSFAIKKAGPLGFFYAMSPYIGLTMGILCLFCLALPENETGSKQIEDMGAEE